MKELIEKGKNYFTNNYKQHPIVIDKGEGSYVFDKNGKKYLDFVSGIAVNSLGYNHKLLNDALNEQIKSFLHCSNLYYNKPSIEAAEKLIKASGLSKVFFCNSGAEANEAAIKLCRKYANKTFDSQKYEIITMKNSFHGRTIATITATGQLKYQEGFGPLLPGIKYSSFNDIEDLKKNINNKTCGILLEVIQGEGGINTIEYEFLKTVREICDENNIALVFDEVQTGIGRTGKIFAYEHFGIKPDIISLAKGLGSGLPIGGIIANEKYAKGFEPGDHASTFGGNPLACTAANVVLNELLNNNLLENVIKQGEYLKHKLLALKDKNNKIVEIKGMGLMQGISLKDANITELVQRCMDKGLLLVGAGSNVIRFVPPLTINEKEIDEGIEILESCI